MKFLDLPLEYQEKIKTLRRELRTKNIDTPYEVCVYNENGNRFLHARRVCMSWNDDKGNSMPFGGGTYWTIRYGEMGWKRVKYAIGGGYDVELAPGTTYNRSWNGTEVPKRVATKAEVRKLIAAIGIF